MKYRLALVVLTASLLATQETRSQYFFGPTSSPPTYLWTDSANWSGGPNAYPNLNTESATLPTPSGDLAIDLNAAITINALTVNKPSGTGQVFNTSITGSATNTLTLSGATPKIDNVAGVGTGLTTISAPIVMGTTLNVNQADNSALQLMGEISGTGIGIGLNLNRTGTGGGVARMIVLGTANTYTGQTTLTGSTGSTNQNFLVVRLDNADSIPAASNIVMVNTVILGLNAGDFTRSIGSAPGQFRNAVTPGDTVGATSTGWAAFGADRAVRVNNSTATVLWGSSGLNQPIMALGHALADRTIDFQNGLNLNSGGGNTSARTFRIGNGAAAIDAKISGSIITTNSSSSDVEFVGDGVLSLTAANTYTSTIQASPVRTGASVINGPTIRLDHAQALTPNGNLTFTGSGNGTGSILGLGTDNASFTRSLGTGTGVVQFTGNGGFAAFGGNKSVNLGNAGTPATVTWGIGNFVPTGSQLFLSDFTADGTLDFQNPIALGNAQRTISVRDGTALIDAVLSNGVSDGGLGGGLLKREDGTLQLVTTNSYTGQTSVNGGSLRLDHANALPGASQLVLLGGGVIGLGIGHTDFTRAMGTGAGQVSTSGTGGGFSAIGGTKVVRLNNDDVTPIVWKGVGSFFNSNQLVLSNDDSDSTVEFQNAIDINGNNATQVGTIQVRNGSAVVDGRMSRPISGTGTLSSLIKTSPGTLELSAANTYQGTTSVNSGVVLLTNANAIPGGINGGNTGNIIFGGTGANGTLGLGIGDFTSPLGTLAGQVDLGTSAGLAAYFGNRVVNFGGASAQVAWRNSTSDPGNFVVSSLRLSDSGADATVDLQNPIDLNAAARTVNTSNGTANIDAVLSGVLSGTGASLIKSGGGTLKLTAANTYNLGTTISAGRLLVSNTSGSGTGSGAVTVNNGGTLGGTGIVSGAVTVELGGHVAPGESIESLDVASLLLNTGSVLDFELGATGSPGVTSDLLNVTTSGGLAIDGGSVVLTDAGGLAAGTYTLIDYSGAFDANDVALLGTPTGPAGFTYSLGNNAGNTSIDLLVTAVPTGTEGDYDNDGTVDAADYVLWRTGGQPLAHEVTGVTPGSNTPEDYDAWRARFGNPGPGAGSSLGGSQGVPEPTTLVLLLVVVPLLGRREFARRQGSRP